MAEFTISISVDDLKNSASELKAINDQIKIKLDEVTSEMAKLSETTWSSDAADQIRSKFMKQKDRFIDFDNVVKSYINFLNETIDKYTQAENDVNKMVANDVLFK